ncbi:MAG: hypothetical protein CVV27_09730, partial [Candidatus Melainabacteria bacterium HGW-Melainabacteria-1]
ADPLLYAPAVNNSWHQWVLVWSSENEILHYLDGQLYMQSGPQLATELQFGSEFISPRQGHVDEIELYARELTPAQIKTLYDRRALKITGTGLSLQSQVSLNGEALTTIELDPMPESPLEALTVALPANTSLPALLEVRNPNGPIASVNVTALPPRVDEVRPTLVREQEPLRIRGRDFGSAVSVSVNGEPLAIESQSATELIVTVPAGLSAGPLLVSNPGPGNQTAGPAIEPMPSGLTACYTFDQLSLNGLILDPLDDKIGDRDLTLQLMQVDGELQSAEGKIDSGAQFINATASAEAFTELASSYSLSTWVKTASGAEGHILSLKNALDDSLSLSVLNTPYGGPDGAKLKLTMRYQGTTQYEFKSEALVRDFWYHVAVVKTPNQLRVYLNHEQVFVINDDLTFSQTPDLVLNGPHPLDDGLGFDGVLDELMLFNRDLTADEVRQLFHFMQ